MMMTFPQDAATMHCVMCDRTLSFSAFGIDEHDRPSQPCEECIERDMVVESSGASIEEEGDPLFGTPPKLFTWYVVSGPGIERMKVEARRHPPCEGACSVCDYDPERDDS